MRHLISFILLFTLLQIIFSCRFANKFNQQDLLKDEKIRNKFIDTIIFREGKFHQHGIGYNAKSGMTYDGRRLDFDTGLPANLQFWTASSKEALHIHMISLALEGNERALLFFHSANCNFDLEYCKRTLNRVQVEEELLNILSKKMDSYEKFNKEYPGFGGHLPWVFVNDNGFERATDWQSSTPSLDNGELAMAIYGLLPVLREKGHYQLLKRYQNWFNLMARSAKYVFYEGNGNIRTVSIIKNVTSPPHPNNYETPNPCGHPCYLDDPYEGELFVWLLEFFGGISQSEADKIWIKKRKRLESVNYITENGDKITCQRGHWFSSHEQWKYLTMPYLDVPINRRIYINGEKARTWNSFEKRIPGMFASVGNVTHPNGIGVSYLSALGIQELAFEKVVYNHVVTPYATFPVFLANQRIGLIWYHNHLLGSKMQNIFGNTESITVNGDRICPLVTWDSKITTVLAMLGGAGHLAGRQLKYDQKYESFCKRVNDEWSRVFTDIKGEELDYALPSVQLPNVMPNFPNCN